MLEGRSHVVFASSRHFIDLQILQFSLMFKLGLVKSVLVLQLVDFALHLSLQAFILEILHLHGLFELAYLKIHEAFAVIL